MPSENTQIEESPWKSLGFDTFDAYASDQKDRLDKATKQAEDRGSFIDRQGEEIGSLRGEIKDLMNSVKKQGDTTSQPTESKEPDKGDGLDAMSLGELEAKLTTKQSQQAASMLESLDEQGQAIASQSAEAQAAFLRVVMRTQPTPPTSFLDRLKNPAPKREENLEKVIQGLFSIEAGSIASAPVADHKGIPGMARTQEELHAVQEAAVQRNRNNPKIVGADLSSSLRMLRDANGK